MTDFDPENPVTELDRRELAQAAFRWTRGPAASRYKDPARIAADRAFDAWWQGEQYGIAKRGSLRLFCQAAWNASVARADEYEPGDGFSLWWRAICDEARLLHEGIATGMIVHA